MYYKCTLFYQLPMDKAISDTNEKHVSGIIIFIAL